jgi:hypothetical protein
MLFLKPYACAFMSISCSKLALLLLLLLLLASLGQVGTS